ncbi:MAG: RagB/SusD family nutrient uptake outer membrane protein [Lunatimonas sp.]|uniref:RagB/SusD family nutrient uptake outer membrane protein n=1 Tax=Lunatimonas sp. TaxID=2060141 RepID=UPI00263B1BB8|nr:RagB/SusD family nutrient uptake outer membrane protein [Lunatimonas sp.]MCC5937630.1 RagB/SusD family nutrient uptake outer membrane protein [Lunatimonas sp.]
MKSLIKYSWTLLILVAMSISSCMEDFLERYPLDAMTDATYFTSPNDLKVMANGFYRLLPRYHFQGQGNGAQNNQLDANTDLQVGTAPSGFLFQRGATGEAPATDGSWNSSFSWIRQINYLINNARRVAVNPESNQYTGEAYFFRAWVYMNLLDRYGDVPIYTEVLTTDSERLYKARDPRSDVARFIIQDLDSAIANLGWKNSTFAASGRVTKEAALVMKARAALFEGTWQRYHGAKSTPFAVTGQDGSEFLRMVEPTIQQLIDRQGATLFTNGGPFNEPYNQLFSQQDASSSQGVFLYRIYNVNEIVGHNFYDLVVDNAQAVTWKLVSSYLDKEGIPQHLSGLPIDYTSLNSLGENLDPRFRQTIWTPDRGPQQQIPGYRTTPTPLPLRYPQLNNVFSNNFTSTGLRRWKGAIMDENEWRNGSTDEVLIRYAEGLLALAEAKAILGTINQGDLDKTVNLLRARVGMTPMSLAEINTWPIQYSTKDGFDPSESNIVNEIRRERVVELAFEGHRQRDLKRWAIFHDVINEWKPKGAHFQEFVDYYNDPSRLAADGINPANTGVWQLRMGENFSTFNDGSINPFFRNPDFREGGEGFFIEPDRVYLSPIPRNEIEVYADAGYELKQNPGWF